jgi:hypothetical protein
MLQVEATGIEDEEEEFPESTRTISTAVGICLYFRDRQCRFLIHRC